MSVSAGAVSHERLCAWAYLSAVVEPPAPASYGFVAVHGAEIAADRIRSGNVPGAVVNETAARREHVCGAELLERAHRSGIRLVTPEHGEWPGSRSAFLEGATEVGLSGLAPPMALWCRGNVSPEAVSRSAVAVVGARAATGYGESCAAELGYELARSGTTVVSGAAYGIDGAAHRGALAAGGATAAILACGPELDYPAGHARLIARIAENGLVCSEYPPGTPPRKHRFLVRNRLIAAVTDGTVVVEAGLRSGAGNTATTTDTLGLPVMAVPGPVTSANSSGCHELIRSGKAVLVTGAPDVLELVSDIGTARAPEREPTPRPTDELDEVSKRVHDSLSPTRRRTVEQLAHETGITRKSVVTCLSALEISGFVRCDDRGWTRCDQ
ncbi:DNA processing protein [Actinopolyspora lacussalsi]|nr:DNA processing protein [Actinopolyspora lacussalsi]